MSTLTQIVIAGVGGLVVLWLLLIVGLAMVRPDGTTLREAARILPDAVRLVSRLSRNPALGRSTRFRLLLVVVYLALPIDLVPDFIPVLGYADDAILIGLVIRSLVRRAGPDIVRQTWPGTDAGLDLLARLCSVPALRTP
ncbi:MAG: DUF1232 domain-containing protein [Acidobacteria bacterium]|nr:DUF1232 domain-containing protein [Acidobacteriota bacterium]